MTAKRFFPARIRLTLIILSISTALGAGNLLADEVDIKGDAPQSYTVVKGDTLWGISGKYLDKPWQWPDLWEGNPQIANPHLIYPGDILSLYYVDGQPRLGITQHSNQQPAAMLPSGERATVKLSPQIHASPINDAIPVIPVEAIQQFLHKLSVLDKTTFESAPYVIRSQEGRIIAAQGDRIYVKGELNSGDRHFQIYHLADPIKDPATGNIIGHEGKFVGDAKLDRIGDPSTLIMTSSAREVVVGDRVVARDPTKALNNFNPKVPDQQVNGQILNIVDGVGILGRFQAVIINLGTADGLSRGHVLSAFTKGETINDSVSAQRNDTVTLPDERSGTLMVIEAFENLSYALAMESRLVMRVLDEVRTPE